ncbi:MAG: TIGR00725 family protein [Candidatus Omnitrophota bacterium]
MKNKKILISVIGGHKADKQTAKNSFAVGCIIGKLGAILVCGGLTGVMQQAARGAKSQGGLTVGILPGKDKNQANPYIDIPIPTGLGFIRNTLVASCADIIIALSGKAGTLSEIGFALSEKKTVLGLNTWRIPGVIKVKDIKSLEKKLKKLLR